uniref:Gustatory receptor n=1 Tax=Tetranychus urticae TaxID=32264 RepID=T1KPA8_TETUR
MFSPTSSSPPKQMIFDGFILPAKYILGRATKFFLLFSLAFCPAFRIAYQSIYGISHCNYTTKLSIFECVYTTVSVIVLSAKILLALFSFNLDYYKKYVSNIELLSIETNTSAARAIKRNLGLNLIIHVIPFIGYIILSLFYMFSYYQDIPRSVIILLIISEFFIEFGVLFLLNMICNTCIYLRAAFNQVNSQIATLNGTSNQSFNHLFDEIRNLRKSYSYAVRSTRNAEKFFRFFITLFYIKYFSYNIINIVQSFGPQTKIDLIFLVPILIQTVQLIILTYNLVSVNNLSRQGLEDLYEFSFKLNSLHLYHENDIFMARMALSDVGFTFANLFTINNSFITSLFTLSLTIILALASFIYH